MCGFVAIINGQGESINLIEIINTIQHRGPDDRGWCEWSNGNIQRGRDAKVLTGEVLLGHVRLSIIDLTDAGWQPMSSADNRYHIVFNGEIYNYLELRSELEMCGHVFHTHTDTEVLLVALVEWGVDALVKLRGMFAFCFFDSSRRELLLARDFFGIKPLYFSEITGGVAFASEQKALLQLPGVGKHINSQALYEYLSMGVTDHGTGGLLTDIKQLLPAHFLRVSIDNPKKLVPICYWKIDINNRIAPEFDVAVKRVRELFLQSVALHLRSDVPIGTALSGGIDSSAIVCAVRHLNPDQEIHTFSFIADDERISEEVWVDVVNKYVNAIPHKVRATREEMVSDLEDLIHAQGEPFGSTSIYAQYRVFKEAAANHIKVMLDGQGADEMLGGYVSYQGSRLASLLKQMDFIGAASFLRASSKWPGRSKAQLAMHAAREVLPDWARGVARRLISKGVPPNWLSKEWIDTENINVRPHLTKGTYDVEILRASLLKTLQISSVPHLLRYEDRNSMRFSIESRVPFLYTDLVEYLFSLPEEYLIAPDGTSKYVFREAMRGIVPDAILDRRDKIGFETPEHNWLTKMDQWVTGRLAQGDQLGCFQMDELRSEWALVVSGHASFNFRYWRWLNAIEWHSYLMADQKGRS